jgi:glycosyltransferase involved in cell wall biosynthesis
LDCYYYRTGTWVEPWGRVVVEALACGVPVVAHRRGGYAEAIESGRNGFLFDDTEEAVAQIGRLMRDSDLKAWMGREARASAERIVGPDAMRRLAAFYLFEPASRETGEAGPFRQADTPALQARRRLPAGLAEPDIECVPAE